MKFIKKNKKLLLLAFFIVIIIGGVLKFNNLNDTQAAFVGSGSCSVPVCGPAGGTNGAYCADDLLADTALMCGDRVNWYGPMPLGAVYGAGCGGNLGIANLVGTTMTWCCGCCCGFGSGDALCSAIVTPTCCSYSADYYRINSYTTLDCVGAKDANGSNCRKIINGGTNHLFVPAKTTAEWNSFISHPPSGVSVPDC